MNYPNPAATKSSPTRVALLAVGPRDAALLELMLQRFLGEDFVLVAQDQAEMAIVDGDAANGVSTLARWQERKQLAPIIVLSLQARTNSANVTYIRKPINIHNLIDTLSELRPYARRASSVALASIEMSSAAKQVPSATTAPDPVSKDGPVVVGDDESNKVVSVEICMSSDLDEIFSASDVHGPGLAPTAICGASQAHAAPLVQRNQLFRNILAKLDMPAGR
jgi:hypothetical protein